MEYIYMKARAKINLTLEILNKRKDNYHNLKSIFQKISLYDEIYIFKTNNDNFELEINNNKLTIEDNIIYKAYLKLKESFKNISGIKVILNKNIPMQAGLGGGSTDCASFVIGINKLFRLNLKENEIIELCESLGADVVPCLYNQAIIAESKGECITKIKTNFKYYILIIKPKASCSTARMFKIFDDGKLTSKSIKNTENVIKALESNDIDLLASNLYNDFEQVFDVKDIKEELIKNLAVNALLTGSGSCVFGVFRNKKEALNAYKVLKEQYEIYICTSYNKYSDVF